MISNRSGSNQSEFMQALVPMVDLFAVLAIVFMIHSNEEITAAQTVNDERLLEIVTQVQEARDALGGIDEAERARRERRELLANTASKSLEEIREEREREAQELLTQFTEMLAAQQSSTDTEYATMLARIENDLEQQTQADLAETRAELETDLESQRSELAAQQEQRIEEARKEFDRIISSTETRLASSQDALVDAEQARVDALATQASALDEQRQLDVARAEQELRAQADRQAANSRRETDLALARAEQARVDALATQASALDEQRQLDVARAEQELRAQADRQAADSRRETDLALARAEQARVDALAAQAAALDVERQSDLAAQRTALEEERARALADAADELAPYLAALEAKNQIIEELNQNFKDFDSSAVEIDLETGKVKLHFEQSYFALGSHELSQDMKSFLRAMIPRYAQSIYGNGDAATHVESLNISGMASPVYQGVYIDIFDQSPETDTARQYNMTLSNRRAESLYSFIFNADEMGDYEFRTRMEQDMSIAALGFQNATPVKDELVGKPARCIEYDCQQEQATILQFQLFSGGL